MPVARADTTRLAAVIKQIYTDGVPILEGKAGPLYERIAKKTDWVGDPKTISLQHALPQGSNTLSTAVTNSTPGKYVKMTFSTGTTYVPVYLDRKTIKLTRNDAGALVRSVKRTIDGGILSANLNLATELYRDGTGKRGTQSTVTGYDNVNRVLTLGTPRDIVNFSIDMSVTDYATLGHTGRIASIDRRLGTMTFAVGASNFTGDTDICRAGDKDAAINGLAKWLPYTAPVSGDSFGGLDRSVDPEMLAGGRLDISTYAKIEEGITDALLDLSLHGGPPPDLIVMNPSKYGVLIKSLGTKTQRDQDDASARWSYKGVKVYTEAGEVEVISDLRCPLNRAYVLRMDSWSLESAGPCPEIFDDDGQMIRESSNDSYEVRIGGYPQAICDAPGWNMVLNI